MKSCLRSIKLMLVLAAIFSLQTVVWAAEPVRLAITAESGSGIEQEIVDYISAQIGQLNDAVVNTVNPDWIVQCKIIDSQDRMTGQIRYNGTATIKTTDGQVVGTVSVQKYNQDYSLQSGAPLNKQLVDSAAREVTTVVGQRAVEKIEDALVIEMKSREQISESETLANNDKYDEAIALLKQVGRDSVHFKAVQKVIAQYEMEKNALALIREAEVKAAHGQYSHALTTLKDFDAHSKRYKLSKQLSAKYRNLLAAAQAKKKSKTLAKNNSVDVKTKAMPH